MPAARGHPTGPALGDGEGSVHGADVRAFAHNDNLCRAHIHIILVAHGVPAGRHHDVASLHDDGGRVGTAVPGARPSLHLHRGQLGRDGLLGLGRYLRLLGSGAHVAPAQRSRSPTHGSHVDAGPGRYGAHVVRGAHHAGTHLPPGAQL